MPDYQINILFADDADALTIELAGWELLAAEQLAADLRYQVEEAQGIDAPVLEFARPGIANITVVPSGVVSIDLQETGLDAH